MCKADSNDIFILQDSFSFEIFPVEEIQIVKEVLPNPTLWACVLQ